MDCSCGQFYGVENKPAAAGDVDDVDDESTLSFCLLANDDDDCSLVSSRCFSTTTFATTTTARGVHSHHVMPAAPPQSQQQQQPLLDASFVHLPRAKSVSLLNYQESTHHFASSANSALSSASALLSTAASASCGDDNDNKMMKQKLTLEYYQHLQLLEQVATANSTSDSQPLLPLSLCVHCAERVLNAMEADTERLENECRLYRQAMQDEDIRVCSLKRAILRSAAAVTSSARSPSEQQQQSSLSSSSSCDNNNEHENNSQQEEVDDDDQDSMFLLAESNFKTQLDALQESCRHQQVEYTNVLHLLQEQVAMSRDLDIFEWQVQEERNALELEAQAFDNELEQLHGRIVDTTCEVEQLSSSALRFPSLLYDLRVVNYNNNNNNQQQSSLSLLQHPTINELRLAYRPFARDNHNNNNIDDNDSTIQWPEIQAAWSLAAQLLLAIGSLLEFTSRHWKIVPLSHCAKLIYYPPPPSSSSQKQQQQQQQQHHHHGQPPATASGIVYNLGHAKSDCAQALVTWNGLLHSMVQHAMTKIAKARERGLFLNSSTTTTTKITFATTTTAVAATAGTRSSTSMEAELLFPKPLPFAMSVNSIGPHRTWPDANDDAGWSRVIHCMSCNLLWLSNVASTLTLQEVLLATCTIPSS